MKYTALRPMIWTDKLNESIEFYSSVLEFSLGEKNEDWGSIWTKPFLNKMTTPDKATILFDGDYCKVKAGTHKGKSGLIRDIKKSKTGVRFKTLGKNVEIIIQE